jgi:hypothetical protein
MYLRFDNPASYWHGALPVGVNDAMNLLWHLVSVAVVVGGTCALWGTSVRPNGSVGPVAGYMKRDSGAPPSPCGSNLQNITEVSVLYVMDPNSRDCFEEVGIDPYTNQTLLSWVMGLMDALTATESHPEEEKLMVSLERA